MIGSRFHALVSALSQGVPAFAIGWSHKYEELFADYEFIDGIINLENFEQEYKRAFRYINNDGFRDELVLSLLSKSSYLKKKSLEMWMQVFNVIKEP